MKGHRVARIITLALGLCCALLSPAHAQMTQQGPKLVGTGVLGGNNRQGFAVAFSADGNTAVVGGYGDNSGQGAAWIWTRSGGTWTEQAKLVASDAIGTAYQGCSVSLSADGNTAVVGGYGDNSGQGAAWIWTRSGVTWTEQAKLVASDATGRAYQGTSVSLSADGSTALVGGYYDNGGSGAAWIWTRSGGAWTQQSKLAGSGAIGQAQQGYSVSLSADGGTAIVGGPNDNNYQGAAWTWTRSGGTWAEQAKLVASDAIGQARQGYSVSLSADGNTALVGGYYDNGGSGAAWIWTRSGGTWTQHAKLVASDAIGQAYQGYAVSLSADGSTAFVGGYYDNSGQGAAWIWTRSGGTWTQQAKLVASDAIGTAYQGGSVSLSADGNTAVVGGFNDNRGQGAAWTWTRSGGTWTEQAKLVASDATGQAYQGWSISVSADGNTAVVGGMNDNQSQGAAWIWARSGGAWTQQAKLVASDAIGTAYQGYSVSLSADGSTAIVGGPDDNSGSGAAWIWTRSGVTWTQQAKLVGSGTSGSPSQGSSVSLSADGGTAVVGGPYDNGQGAAWIWTRSGGTWTQQAKLLASDAIGSARQGLSVSLSADGNAVLVGGPYNNSNEGAAWVWTRSGGTWTEQARLVDTRLDAGLAQEGTSVALSADGGTAVIGGISDNSNYGAAWVWTRTGGTWSVQTKLVGSGALGPSPRQGHSVAVSASGDTALVGGYYDNNSVGAAWLWTRTGGAWTQQAKLVGSDAAGTSFQGWSVSLCADGSTAVVGGPYDNNYQGAAWVFGTLGFNLTASAGAHGTISPAGSTRVSPGASLTYTIAPDPCYAVASVLVDGVPVGAVTGYTFTNVQADHAISATFVATSSYTITASAGPHGAISPAGAVSAACGTSASFTITPAACYVVADVQVDGVSVGAVTSYTFTNVQAAHTIHATFAPVSYTITASAGTGGNISPAGAVAVACGASQAFTITPAGGYALTSLVVDGTAVTPASPYTFTNVTASHTIVAGFGSTITLFQQAGPLVGSGMVGAGNFGWSVAMSADGNTAIVGGLSDNAGAGAAWVYTRNNGTWVQQAKLVGTGAVGAAQQGYGVALSADGNTAAVGGGFDNGTAGAVWVYTRSGGSWSQQAKLVASGNIGNALVGTSVGLSSDGNTLVAGGENDNGSVGAAWVWTRGGSAWTQQAKLVGSGASGTSEQGAAVAISGDGGTVLVGGLTDNANHGAVWVYTRSGSTWTQQGAKLVGGGEAGGGYFGIATALSADGNTALVGGDNDNGSAGAAWAFTRSGGTWTQQGAKLVGSGAVGTGYQGSSVSLSADGSTALVGGQGDDNFTGATWQWTRSGGTWTELVKLVGTGGTPPSRQGQAVALAGDGHTAVVGGYADHAGVGAAWMFVTPGYPVTASAGAHGAVSPAGTSTVSPGGSLAVTVTPDSCWTIADVQVDGVSVGAVTSYTFTNVQAAHTLNATFVAVGYTITASAGAGGSISPAGAVAVACGAGQAFTLVANAGYALAGLVVDGVAVAPVTPYTFANVAANHTIVASFTATAAVIAAGPASAAICPANSCVSVPVTIARTDATPVEGYSVTFQLSPGLALCAGTASVSEGTFLSPSGSTAFRVVDNGGGSYTVDDVLLGNCGPATTAATLFTIQVTSALPGGMGTVALSAPLLRNCTNHALAVVAGPVDSVTIDNQPPAVTLTSPLGGETWPIGGVRNITWTATDNAGVASVDLAYSTDGGASYPYAIASGLGNSGSYAWTVPNAPTSLARVRVTAHDVHCGSASAASPANFAIVLPVVTITASSSAGGTITPAGSVVVPVGGTQAFAISPLACSHVVDVQVDGVSVGAVTGYTFTNVQASHTITASFAPNASSIAAVTSLSATQVKAGNDASGTTRVTLGFTAPPGAATVEVWRRGFGSYPLYDTAPGTGAAPSPPSAYPPAGWTLTPVSATGQGDHPASRDYVYYVAYARDSCGNVSAVSNMTTGTLDYHLGDVSDGSTPGQGDNVVDIADLSLLGAHYGQSGAALAGLEYLDVGPTSDQSTSGRPTPDSRTDFEDLILMSLNFTPQVGGPAGPSLAGARPHSATLQPAGANSVTVHVPAQVQPGESFDVPVLLAATRELQAVSVTLAWDPARVEPVGVAPGELVAAAGAVMLSPGPGRADAAVLGTASGGFAGTGAVAVARFRAIASGEPAIRVAGVLGRDAANRAVSVSIGAPVPVASTVSATDLLPVTPNPTRGTALVQYSLARPGAIDLSIYSVDGRRVRTLVHGVQDAGLYGQAWDGADESGARMRSGIYYVRLLAPALHKTRIINLVR